jgi:hypothetical protein
MKKVKYTPWQLWAQEYMREYAASHGTYNLDTEDADRYAHAAWNACRARVLEILERNKSSYTSPDAPPLQMCSDIEFIDLRAIEEIEKL